MPKLFGIDVIPAADDQVRTEDADLGDDISHAICEVCYPEHLYYDKPDTPLPAICGRVSPSAVPDGTPRCPDCVDLFGKPPKCHKE